MNFLILCNNCNRGTDIEDNSRTEDIKKNDNIDIHTTSSDTIVISCCECGNTIFVNQ